MTHAMAEAIADRIIDEDEAIARPAGADGVVETALEVIRAAAATDGVDDDEALEAARAIRLVAEQTWLASPAGRHLLEVVLPRALARDRRVIGNGITTARARTLERVATRAIAERFAERGSERAEKSAVPGVGTSKAAPDARPAGGGS